MQRRNLSRKTKLASSRKKREEELYYSRMNYKLRKNQFTLIQENADSLEYFIAIGHGEHLPYEPIVKIPNNVYLVYTTAAGYWGNMADSLDPKFLALTTSLDKIKRLVKGTLQPNEIPELIQGRKWDWRNHIYPPESYSVEHSLKFYDTEKNNHPLRNAFDKIAGMYHVPSPHKIFNDVRPPMVNGKYVATIGKSPEVLLSQILKKASREAGDRGCMVFISGCRGDPRIATRMKAYMEEIQNPVTGLKRQNIELAKPQTYTIIRTPSNLMGRVASNEKRHSNWMRTHTSYNENSIKKEVKNLPTGSRGIPSDVNIRKFGQKYQVFLRSKNLTARNYIKRVLNPKREEIVKKWKKAALNIYQKRQKQKENLKKALNRRIALKKFEKTVKKVYPKLKAAKTRRNLLDTRIREKQKQKEIINKARKIANYVRRFNSIPGITVNRIVNYRNRNSFFKYYYTLHDLNEILKGGNTRNINSILRNNFQNRNLSNNNKRMLPIAYSQIKF